MHYSYDHHNANKNALHNLSHNGSIRYSTNIRDAVAQIPKL